MSSEAKNRRSAEKPPQTCDTCKLRHQKCSGTRPTCHHCALRCLQCNYSNTQAHKTHPAAVRRKSLASDSNDSSSPSPKRRAYDTEASATSAHYYSVVHEILMTGLIDSGLTSQGQSELSRLLTDRIVRKTRFPQPPEPHVLPPGKSVDTYFTTPQHLISILARIWTNELGEESSTILGGTAADEENASPNLTMPSGGSSCSLASRRGPNKLFHICSPTESQRLLDSLYDPQQGISRISECLITWQLAVGSRFTADTDEQIHTAIYESARMQVENCIEKDDDILLWVVPTLLLRCIYLMHPKPRNCWLLLGLAIRVAQTYRIDLKREQCPHLSDVDYSRWREVWRAIIFLDCWLAITLGRMSQITALTSQDPFIQNIRSELRRPNHELEVNMAKLAVLMSEFLTNVNSPNKVDLTTHERYLYALEEWSSSLPQSLRYFPNSSNATRESTLSIEDEFASLYLEGFYFASVLIVTTPLLLDVVTMWRGREDMCAPMNVRFFAQTCAQSAIQIAHVSTTMVQRGFICQRSWLVTTLNYYASLVLALSLSVKGSKARWNLTSAQEGSHRELEMNGLELSMGVLSYCAQQDPYAGHFLKTVSIFKDLLEAQRLSEPEQPQNPTFGWTNWGLGRPSVSYMPRSGSSSEATSSESLANLDLTPSTVASTFDLRAYPSTSSLPTPSFTHTQYASAQQFNSPLAQTGSQSDTYPMSRTWRPSSTFTIDPAMDLGINRYTEPSNPITQHYQPFLQAFYHSEDAASRSQS